jgi:signal transduction histidine kinase
VSDDGCGFDASVDREAAGHWGLRGMRERAAKVNARLSIERGKPSGTVVRLEVPSGIAYQSVKRRRMSYD